MNQVTRIADDYFIVRDGEQVAGVLVKLENDTWIPYVHGYPVRSFANLSAALEYVESDPVAYQDDRAVGDTAWISVGWVPASA